MGGSDSLEGRREGHARARALAGLVGLCVAALVLRGSTPGAGADAETRLADPPPRGAPGDSAADVILGKPDFGEITPNEVAADRLFRPGGVVVDRSVRPNRLYVYDGGNSRVLGLSHIGACAGGSGAGAACTADSDCPGSTCAVQGGIGADLVIGQPSLADHSACNGDGNHQRWPARAPARADTLCGMPEAQVSVLEGGSHASMAVDPSGNLYVPDFDNNRVLRYDSPFTTDTFADDVWGQDDFGGNLCNRGRARPDASSLCLRSPTNQGFVGGVDVDAAGNLWVTDNQNNRVLRFSADPNTGRPDHGADLVLGQVNYSSAERGDGLDRMSAPAAVRVAPDGAVLVADSLNDRVLVFEAPFVRGMPATRTLGTGLHLPTGIDLDPQGGIWVSDSDNNQLLRFEGGAVTNVLFKDVPTYTRTCGGPYRGDGALFTYPGGGTADPSNVCDARGSIGIDVDGNVFVAANTFVHDVWRFPAPFSRPTPGVARSADATLFTPYRLGQQNAPGLRGLYAPRGVAVAAGQVVVADEGQLRFWNDPASAASGRAADGSVGTTDLLLQPDPDFGRIRQDARGRLWALRGGEVQAYALPLATGAEPTLVLRSPLPVAGGGEISWTGNLFLGGVAPVAGGDAVWVADPIGNRVLRIVDTATRPTIDVVLGQADPTGTGCNRGRGPESPSRDSLCAPGAVALDPSGNLYVSDHALEVSGNHRLLEFDASLFPERAAKALIDRPASRVFGTGGRFDGPCIAPLCGPWEPAFDGAGRMVVGFNGYIGSRFPAYFQRPLEDPTDYGFLRDFGSMPYAAAFDASGDLYVADLDRARVLVYRRPGPEPTPTATPTSTPTRTPTPRWTPTSPPRRPIYMPFAERSSPGLGAASMRRPHPASLRSAPLSRHGRGGTLEGRARRWARAELTSAARDNVSSRRSSSDSPLPARERGAERSEAG